MNPAPSPRQPDTEPGAQDGARRLDAQRPPAPVCPRDDECCQSGCDPCVFDRYAEELERYRAALRRWEEQSAANAP